MLNSDSDFEYPDTGLNSEDESSSEGALMGKIALGIDPSEMRSYDGRSTPQNGSQYLLKVMAEKRRVPKVAYADPRKLPVPAVVVTSSSVSERKDSELINPNYLERFMQMCSAYEEEKGKLLGEVNMKLLPSAKWREESISGFSETRSKIDRWRYKIEGAEIFLNTSVKLPPNNDNIHWLKFCFGQSFVHLSSTRNSKTAEEKLEDFFLDLYDPSTSIKLEDDIAAPAFGEDGKNDSPESPKGSESTSAKVCGGGGGGDADSAKVGAILDTKFPPGKEKTNPDGDGTNVQDKVKDGLTKAVVDNANSEVEVVFEKESATDSEPDSDTSQDPGTPIKTKTARSAPHSLGHRPLMNVVLRLNQTQLENLVKWNLLWLRSYGFVNECQGQWLYAVLACLGKPIEPTIMSDLRNIARILISVRNSISDWSSDFDELQENNETTSGSAENKDVKIFDFINTLNLFIYIIADYFQQKDLVMHL